MSVSEAGSSEAKETMDMDLQITEDVNHPEAAAQPAEESGSDETTSEEIPPSEAAEEQKTTGADKFQTIAPIEIPKKTDDVTSSEENEEAVTEKSDKQSEEKQTAGDSKPASSKMVSPTLGEIYAAQGQYEKAIKVFETLLERNPGENKYEEKIKELNEKLKNS